MIDNEIVWSFDIYFYSFTLSKLKYGFRPIKNDYMNYCWVKRAYLCLNNEKQILLDSS